MQGDERLIALIREGQERAFEALVDRYQVRLLAFCRGMLASAEDAEDVLQEVFVAAHKAILADNRAIKARPWLYRIARNRCLNHLRKPVPEGQDTMDVHAHENGVTVADRVQKRAEFRALISDVQHLPETQRSALLLREIDALSYEEIAVAMDTTVPAVKSLLVRARISLADASQGRQLTCDEVHLELAEATEGLRKVTGPARAHIKGCERCREYRSALRRNGKALAALAPIGPIATLGHSLQAKLGLGGAKAGAGGSAGAGAGTAGAGGAGAGAGGSTLGGAAAASSGGGALGLAGSGAAGLGGAALGAKAAAGMASMAFLTAGAVEVHHIATSDEPVREAGVEQTVTAMAPVDKAHSLSGGPIEPPTPSDPPPPPPEEPPPPPEASAPDVPVSEPETPPAPAPAPAPAPDPPASPTPGGGTGNPGDNGPEVPTNPGDSGGVIEPDDPPATDPPVDPPAVPPTPPGGQPSGGQGYEPAPRS